ncbi:hypothetical protein [Litorimonas cladophorae]|nr:hypothetical protein [Litorimonas cladophorae]
MAKMPKLKPSKAAAMLTLGMLMALPQLSSANGVSVKRGEDGRYYAVERPSSMQRRSADCKGISVRMIAQLLHGRGTELFARIIVSDGANTRAFQLSDELNHLLDESHALKNMELGCLSGDGGVGLILHSTQGVSHNAHIQIDRDGRVFTNFDQTGFKLVK